MDNYDQICSDISQGKFSPIYFLSGEEPFFIDRITQLIEENALEESQKGFNQVIAYGRDGNLEQVLGNARKFPVMSDRQVIIVKEAQELQDLSSKDKVELLIHYVQNLNPSSILVFCYKYKKLTPKSPLRAAIQKAGVFFETKKIWDNQLPRYIKAMVHEEGLKLNEKAIDVLFELVGNDLERLHNEIQKLKLIDDHEEVLDDRMIMKYIGSSNTYSIIDLHQAIAHRKSERVMQMALTMYDGEKAELLPLIASLYKYFSRILEAHRSGKTDPNGIQNALKVNFYQAQDLTAAIYNYPEPKVVSFFEYLLEADKQIKGVSERQVSTREILQEMLGKILS